MYLQTQQYVRIYNLSEQKLIKTLIPGIKWISSMDVHPSGDHLIVGGYDRKLCWFDLELSEKPYKVLRYALSISSSPADFSVFIDASLPSTLLDTIHAQFGPFSSTQVTLCSLPRPTTDRFRYSIRAYTTIS